MEKKYACHDCGKLRTKAEGGTTFTVCDECWDKYYNKNAQSPPAGDREFVLGVLKDHLAEYSGHTYEDVINTLFSAGFTREKMERLGVIAVREAGNHGT